MPVSVTPSLSCVRTMKANCGVPALDSGSKLILGESMPAGICCDSVKTAVFHEPDWLFAHAR